MAAKDHVNDIGPKGITSSLGSGNYNYQQLLEIQMDHCQLIDQLDTALQMKLGQKVYVIMCTQSNKYLNG